jgi:hypothetical protein
VRSSAFSPRRASLSQQKRPRSSHGPQCQTMWLLLPIRPLQCACRGAFCRAPPSSRRPRRAAGRRDGPPHGARLWLLPRGLRLRTQRTKGDGTGRCAWPSANGSHSRADRMSRAADRSACAHQGAASTARAGVARSIRSRQPGRRSRGHGNAWLLASASGPQKRRKAARLSDLA